MIYQFDSKFSTKVNFEIYQKEIWCLTFDYDDKLYYKERIGEDEGVIMRYSEDNGEENFVHIFDCDQWYDNNKTLKPNRDKTLIFCKLSRNKVGVVYNLFKDEPDTAVAKLDEEEIYELVPWRKNHLFVCCWKGSCHFLEFKDEKLHHVRKSQLLPNSQAVFII